MHIDTSSGILKYLWLESDCLSFLQLDHPQGIARMVAAFRYRDGAYLVLECPSNSFLDFPVSQLVEFHQPGI